MPLKNKAAKPAAKTPATKAVAPITDALKNRIRETVPEARAFLTAAINYTKIASDPRRFNAGSAFPNPQSEIHKLHQILVEKFSLFEAAANRAVAAQAQNPSV
jgi:hypothetical protein